jgi:hypothetical protein
MSALYPCPCCGYQVFNEPPGSNEVCPICFWEDDEIQFAFPDCSGGANNCSLIEGQRNFAAFGVSETQFKVFARLRNPKGAIQLGGRCSLNGIVT